MLIINTIIFNNLTITQYKSSRNVSDVCTPYIKTDITFVVDVSSSRSDTDFMKVKEYMKSFISNFPVGPLDNRYQFSVVTYSETPRIQFLLNKYENKTDIFNAIDDIEHDNDGVTMTGEALKKVREQVLFLSNGRRPTADQIVVVITDGLSSDPVDTKIQV